MQKTFKKSLKWFRAILMILGILILLLALMIFALQFPKVQNCVADYAADQLSQSYNAKVEIDRVDINFKTHLIFDGLYVEDHHQDTMIYVDHFRTDLARGMMTLLTNEIFIDKAHLRDAVVYIRTREGESTSNLDQVFSKPNRPEDEDNPLPWKLKISKFIAKNVLIDQVNENTGKHEEIFIPNGTAIINPYSAAGRLEIKNIDLQSPRILMEYWTTDQYYAHPKNSEVVNTDREVRDSSDTFITVRDIKIRNGVFQKWERGSTMPRDKDGETFFNPQHIDLEDITVNLNNIKFQNGELTLIPSMIQASSKSGFRIKEFHADKLELLKKKFKLTNVYFETDKSLIQRDIELKYKSFEDFKRFEDKVYLNVDLNNSRIALSEIIHFVPTLKASPFINKNRKMIASIDGDISGSINNLFVKDLSLSIGQNINLEGNIRARDITSPSKTLLNIKVRRLASDVETIKKLVPVFEPPAQFNRLGHFQFSGQFDGFYKDFVAYGELETDIGAASFDMHLDTEKGRAGAKYSGSMALTDFDLDIWTGNPELGKVSGQAEVRDGFSLLPQTAKGDLRAVVSAFTFRDYLYRELKFDGLIESGLLNGSLSIDDENVAFDFSGSLVYGNQEPAYNFSVHIDRVDLYKLNLAKRPMIIAGAMDMDAVDLNPNTIDGDVVMHDWTLIIDDSLTYNFDSLIIRSAYRSVDDKTLSVQSDIIDMDVEGKFVLDKLHLSFLNMLRSNYPIFYDRFKLPNEGLEGLDHQYFDFMIDVKDSQNLFTLLKNSPIDTIRDFRINGVYDAADNYFKLDGYTPKTTIDKTTVFGLDIKSEQNKGTLISSITTDSTFIDDKVRLSALRLDNQMTADTVNFRLTSTSGIVDVVDRFNLGGKLFLDQDNFGVSFNSSELVVRGDKWEVSQNNKVVFNQDLIRTRDLFASNGQQFLYVNSIKDKGIEIGAEYFDVDLINELWVYDKLDFRGQFELFVRTEDVFNLTDFQADLHLDSLFINDDHYGEFILETQMYGVKMPIRAALNIVDEDKYLTAVGMVTPKGFGNPASSLTALNMEVYLENYPANIIEYWIGTGAENTKGRVDAELKLDGPINRVDMSGVGHLKDVETKVIFLGTTYKIEDMDVAISNNLIDVTGGVMVDKYGNKARAVGGITHDKMTDLGLNVELSSDRFLVLDTDKSTGESFYGHALGKMKVNFNGIIDAPDISVTGTTGDSTEIFIPLVQSEGLTESNFVVFDHDTLGLEQVSIKDKFKIEGINFLMNLQVNEKAKMNIIMDELEENIVTGTGNGNILVEMNRSGDFNVFGNYEIEEGSYIYSFENTIKRNFKVAKGSRIQWTGDPYNAQIDITAEYTTSTSIYDFISEYLAQGADPAEDQEAQKNQRVVVKLYITGLLLQPEINFDLAFLNLPAGRLGNYVTTKLNTIQADQSQLNRQVSWLLAFGGFLPNDNVNFGTAVVNSENLTNTVSEFVSNQLSKFISDVLRDAVTNSSFISDFGLTVDYYKNVNIRTQSDDDVFAVNPEFEFLDGKLNLSGGASFVNNSVNGEYVTNDVILFIQLNDNNRLRAKLYQVSDFELTERKLEFGAGITYQRDFDNFFFQSKKDVSEELIKLESNKKEAIKKDLDIKIEQDTTPSVRPDAN